MAKVELIRLGFPHNLHIPLPHFRLELPVISLRVRELIMAGTQSSAGAWKGRI